MQKLTKQEAIDLLAEANKAAKVIHDGVCEWYFKLNMSRFDMVMSYYYGA